MRYTVEKSGTILLGKQGEDRARELALPEFAAWEQEYGPGEAEIIFLPPGGKTPVCVTPTRTEDGAWLWTVTAAETACSGYGKCELRHTSGGAVVKSATYQTYVAESFGDHTLAQKTKPDGTQKEKTAEIPPLIDKESGLSYAFMVEGGKPLIQEEATKDNKYFLMKSGLAVPGGVATLDETGKLAEAQRPVYTVIAEGPPAQETAGELGQHYLDAGTGREYVCVAADEEAGIYTWEGSGGSLPEGGAPGQVLTKTGTGAEWADPTGGGADGGSVLIITFAAAFAGHQYTVTDGGDTKIGAVPEGLAVSVPIVNCSSTYTITSEADNGQEYSTTAAIGQYFGQYTAILTTFRATINVISPVGATITCAGGGETQTITSTGEDAIRVNAAGKYTVTRDMNGKIEAREIEVSEDGSTVPLVLSMRYGYRKTKAEGDPYARITYLYDAEGMTPAHMDFDRGVFDYGDWEDVWFVKKNRPVMLRSDRTVDYELDHSDQTRKLGGGASDISNTGYEGNAMSEIPLGWVHRYEDETYEYEIVCEHQWDDNYKAYAHTRADGSIADCFYWSMFGGSGDASKIRSLADQTAAAQLTATNEIAGSQANGNGWYTHTWSQREYIRTLLVLMGKSTNTQAVFGSGFCCRSGSVSNGPVLQTGTLKDKSQFFGYSTNTQQVKVFYIERFWGDMWDRTAGLLSSDNVIYYKMTPEGLGYRINDVDGYTNTGITISGTNGNYISAMKCGEFGCIPTEVFGSENTYECDRCYHGYRSFGYIIAGGCSIHDNSVGAFAIDVGEWESYAIWSVCCGLSAEQP